MAIRTETVANRIIGDARQQLGAAAGANEIIARSEAKKLPRDLARAVADAREADATVTVDDAVDAYASHVTKVLALVDKTSKGNLSEAEATKILDPALRKKVLAARAELAGGVSTSPPGAGGKPTAAAVVSGLTAALNAVASWHDSGDNGVESSASALAGAKNLTQAMAAIGGGTLGAPTGKAALDAFLSSAAEAMLQFTDGEGQADVDAFAAGVRAQFAPLTSVRAATAADGSDVLLGKAKDTYVAVRVLPYSDG
jgi:hypothetical protein